MVRITTGVTALPPNMYRNFAAWFMIWSRQTPAKSMNINSATGRRPRVAAPTAAPMNADSVIGRVQHPAGEPPVQALGDAEHAAPGVVVARRARPPAMSSPITMTDGSRSISWLSASLIASR